MYLCKEHYRSLSSSNLSIPSLLNHTISLKIFTLTRDFLKIRRDVNRLRDLEGAVASTSSSLLGVLLGHNSSFLQGPAFAHPRIREAIWCRSTNATTEGGVWKTRNLFKVLGSKGYI